MEGFSRKLEGTLSRRLEEKHPLIQVVVGPRQVGKTTALKRALVDRGLYETADSPVPPTSLELSHWWSQASKHPDRILAVDEVQKISGWSEIVKKLWDANPRHLKVILTGSSALLIEKGLKESLTGRFELLRAPHWSLREANLAFCLDLRTYVEFGCYPGSVQFLNDPIRWGAYIRDSIVETVLGRDLLSLHPIENPALLRQIFGVSVGLPASIISLQKILGQLQTKGSIPTIQSYLHLLSQAFLVTAINKYTANVIREKLSSPKLITHDNALLRAFHKPIGNPIDSKIMGFYFENAIGARFIESGWDVFYWKERNWEVDFIVLGPDGERYAIEVKSGTCSQSDLAGLKAFCDLYPDFEPCLISMIGQKIDGIKSLSCEWALGLEPKF